METLPKTHIMNIKSRYLLLILVVMYGCSTKKNTWLSRNYHDLTAHYNVFFNGNESFKEGVKSVENGNQDDYSNILPVFPDSKPENAGVASSQMDRAIEKGTKLIKKHSIRKKPKKNSGDQSVRYQKFLSQNEFNKWVDNAYLLIGKSHFYKQEYYVAQQSFSFMFREFNPGKEWCEAEIWNARAAIELKDYAKAKILLDNYDIEGKAPDRLYGFFAATYADYYIRQGMYEEAIPFLLEAIDAAWSKYYYRRFNFILAQLYHEQKQYAKASKAYEAVIKSNPPYEMAFNAKVNRASVLFGEGGLAAVKKEIKKLLRDKRNADYEDQIYYALAMAYKVENQEDDAMDNFLLSIEKSVDNNHQKGLSFYEMALVFYDRPDYRLAYYNLDTAIVNLNENFPELELVTYLHTSLNDLVDHMNTVEREDSLQRIALLSESERFAFVDQLIEDEKEQAELLKKEKEALNNGDLFFDNSYAQSASQSQDGKWYFYNTSSVGMGKLEFEKKWGRRKLEDNWRRSNKDVVVEEPFILNDPDADFSTVDELPKDSLQSDMQPDAEVKKESNPLSRNFYLANLPLTEEKMKASNTSIEESLLSMGLIYKDELINIPFAIGAFEELIRRFPGGVYLEDALMNLYLCHETRNDSAGMAKLKSQLMSQFPDGEFTAYLNDPDFFKKKEAQRKKIEELYQQTYSNYLFNEFNSSIHNAEVAIQIDEDSELIPKFKFLAGLSYAKMGQLPAFEKELTEIKDTYPDSEVTPVVIEMLKLYSEGRVPVKGSVSSNLVSVRTKEFKDEQQRQGASDSAEERATSYVISNKSKHRLILLVNPETDLNRLKFNIADYNFSKFLLNDYEMSSSKLPDGTPIFSVEGFKNRLEALDYFYSLRERTDIFEVDKLEYFKLYVIHEKNLKYLLSSGDEEGYNRFFIENYLSAEAFKNIEEDKVDDEKIGVDVHESGVVDREKQSIDVKVEEPTVAEKTKVIVEEPIKEEVTKEVEMSVEEVAKEAEEIKIVDSEEVADKKEVAAVLGVDELVNPVKSSLDFVTAEGEHCAVILFKKGRINVQHTGTIFKNYTKSNYATKYEVEYGDMGGYFFIKVNGCKDESEAKAYLAKVKSNSFLMREISNTKYYMWAIINDNFDRLSNEESYEQYQQFYNVNY